jgi:hypothetical protein
MSAKNLDPKGRFRSKTVAFRMSSEEAKQLDILSKLSGLTKQDYLICRVLEKEIIVNGNPRVFKALRNQLTDVLTELQRLEVVSTNNDKLLEVIRYTARIMNGLQQK